MALLWFEFLIRNGIFIKCVCVDGMDFRENLDKQFSFSGRAEKEKETEAKEKKMIKPK